MKGSCYYCERPFGKFGGVIRLRTRDHVIPKSKGGLNNPFNYKDACKRCNNLKDDFTPEQFAAFLRLSIRTGHKKISKATLKIILANVEALITLIRPFRHVMQKSPSKSNNFPETTPKSPTRPSTPLWWRGMEK